MLVTSVIYVFVSRFYRERTYIQHYEDAALVPPVLASGAPT
jgi:hypothetical protein